MRISDWSSDVCSSDLRLRAQGYGPGLAAALPDLGYCDRSLRNAHRLPARYRDDRGKSRPHRSAQTRSEEHTSELQSLMRISYAVFCLKKKTLANITLTFAILCQQEALVTTYDVRTQ